MYFLNLHVRFQSRVKNIVFFLLFCLINSTVKVPTWALAKKKGVFLVNTTQIILFFSAAHEMALRFAAITIIQYIAGLRQLQFSVLFENTIMYALQ